MKALAYDGFVIGGYIALYEIARLLGFFNCQIDLVTAVTVLVIAGIFQVIGWKRGEL
jgi:hypothetical protein